MIHYKKRILRYLICFIFSLVSSGYLLSQDPLEIIWKYQEATRIENITTRITYENISKKGRIQRRELEQYIVKNDHGQNTYNLLLVFRAPADVSGTATLTIQHEERPDDQWLFLPAIGMSRKISPSRKTGRFMGTEMTYEDLSNYLSEPIEKNTYEYEGKELVDGMLCHVIKATPLNSEWEGLSGYSARKLWIDLNSSQNRKTLFFDKKGNPLKLYHAKSFQSLNKDGLIRPQEVIMENMQTGNRTEVSYSNMRVEPNMDVSIFSKSFLESQ